MAQPSLEASLRWEQCIDGSDTITIVGSVSSSAVYGNSGQDSILIGNSVSSSTLGGAMPIFSISGDKRWSTL